MTLQDKLEAGRFAITAEVTPPVSASRDELLDKALPLKGLADAVNVTDGAGARAHLGAVTAAAILVEQGIEPVLQLTCRDRNRIALQSDLLGAAASGVRNLLMLRGDDPSAVDGPQRSSRHAAHAGHGRQRDRPLCEVAGGLALGGQRAAGEDDERADAGRQLAWREAGVYALLPALQRR